MTLPPMSTTPSCASFPVFHAQALSTASVSLCLKEPLGALVRFPLVVLPGFSPWEWYWSTSAEAHTHVYTYTCAHTHMCIHTQQSRLMPQTAPFITSQSPLPTQLSPAWWRGPKCLQPANCVLWEQETEFPARLHWDLVQWSHWSNCKM